MSAIPTCPYCNAVVAFQPGLSAGQKVCCVRCGELFTLTSVPPAPDSSSPVTAPPHRLSNRLVAGIVLGVMGIMAVTGLTYALLTQSVRREHDKSLPRKARRTGDEGDSSPQKPSSLVGLGYLPGDVNLIVAVQAAELLGSKEGKAWIDRALPLGGKLNLETVAGWLGLEARDLDHVVLGLVLVNNKQEANVTPPAYLVVRARRPISLKRVLDAVKAGRPLEQRLSNDEKRSVYPFKFKLGAVSLPMHLAQVDRRTFVIGVVNKLEKVPAEPDDNLDQLDAPLRRALNERLTGGIPAWLVGHAENWEKTWLPTLLAGVKDVPLMDQLGAIRTIALGFQPERNRVTGAVRCADESRAKSLAEKELAPRQKKDPRRFTYSIEGEWITLQLTLSEKP